MNSFPTANCCSLSVHTFPCIIVGGKQGQALAVTDMGIDASLSPGFGEERKVDASAHHFIQDGLARWTDNAVDAVNDASGLSNQIRLDNLDTVDIQTGAFRASDLSDQLGLGNPNLGFDAPQIVSYSGRRNAGPLQRDSEELRRVVQSRRVVQALDQNFTMKAR